MLQKIFLFSESLNPHPLFDQPVLYIFLKNFATICPLIISLAVIMNARKDLNNENIRIEISILILAILFVWGCTTYHFTLLIIPVILLLDFSIKRREHLQSIIILGAYVLCGTGMLNLFYRLPQGILSPLRYMRVWLLICLFIIAIRCFKTVNGLCFRRLSLKIFAASGAAAIVLSIPYFYGLKSIKYDNAVLVKSEKHLYLYGPSVQDDILTCYGADDLAQGRYILFSSNNLFSTRNYSFNSFDPDLSSDGREVIFEVLKDGQSQIGRLIETGAFSLITPENMNCKYPTYHPNGRQFVCSCEHSGKMNIYLRDLSGNHSNTSTGDRSLTELPYNETEPHISPDGRFIAYCSDRTGISKIYYINLSTREEEQITTGNYEDRRPRWSPDGKWIAFSSFRNGNTDIWAVDTKSREMRRVTKDRANDTHPSWGTGGESIYFSSDRGRGIFCPTIYKIPFEK
jgi:Tol biopolymer transport system component